MKKILLVSNSFSFGKGYLEHCEEEIKTLLKPKAKIVFVPYALKDWDGYEAVAKKKFIEMGFNLSSIHHSKNKQEIILSSDAIFIGGGNTFRLLNQLYKAELIDTIRNFVTRGGVYIGTSAGSNVACTSINTTNDMPIVEPPSFEALKLVPFNINPHYIDPDPNSKHMGETRDKRIEEFHEESQNVVIGLREGAFLSIIDAKMILKGETGAKIFQQNLSPIEYNKGDDLTLYLLS